MKRAITYFAFPLVLLLLASFMVSVAACVDQVGGCCADTDCTDCGCTDDDCSDDGCPDAKACHCVCALTSVEPFSSCNLYYNPPCGLSPVLATTPALPDPAHSIDRPPRVIHI